MSVYDDVDFVQELVNKTEKFLCGEIAKLKKSMQAQEEASKALQARVTALETENRTLRTDLGSLQSELAECRSSNIHEECSNNMQRAFTAGLNSLMFAPPLISGDVLNLFTMPLTSTPMEKSTTGSSNALDPSSILTATKLPCDKRKEPTDTASTSQVYTDMKSLLKELFDRLSPFDKTSKCVTRENLNNVQRAMVAYKTNQLVQTNQKINAAFIQQIIQEGVEEPPENKIEIEDSAKTEIRKSKKTAELHVFHAVNNLELKLKPEDYSSLTKFVRVYAWVIRFIENCKVKKEDRETGPLKVSEIGEIRNDLIKDTQREYFSDEYDRLSKNQNVNMSSKLVKLNPNIDSEGRLRSDSRLKYAEYLPYNSRYPILLPRKSAVTEIIVRDAHEKNNHSGTNQTISDLSVNYWIIAAREQIRDCENKCSECKRRKCQRSTQIMAPLPKVRTQVPLGAFSNIAVDYGGPFITMQGRGKRREKRYLCLFTCLSTRAVHLEIAFGLDTNAFLNAFYRMVSQRGLPLNVYSDNGTNFVGADKELKEIVKLMDKDKIEQSVANKGVNWHFNPPLTPHWGGVHEIMIKSAKRAMSAILKSADITDEEFITACTGAEGLINSRPLTYQSANASDCLQLTPNHFLFGQVGGQFAPESIDETPYSQAKRWRRIQELVKHFWKR